MQHPRYRPAFHARRITALLSVLVLGLTCLAAVPAAEAALRRVVLTPVLARYPNQPFPLHGYLHYTGARPNKTIILQRRSGTRWLTVGRRYHAHDGAYSFAPRSVPQPTQQYYRTVVTRLGRTIGVSSTIVVVVKAPPTPGTDRLPDLGVKRLNDCSAAEKSASGNGTCFRIVRAAGGKLLKFPATTYNVGTGPMEVRARRSSATATDWSAVQTISTSNGVKRAVPVPADFYFAGDGHRHWHIRDFDTYQLLDGTGAIVGLGEKHGFCLQDNVSFRDWLDNPAAHPGMPTSEVYLESTSCGQAQPAATSIVHGLSVGWGDTYPTTLVDQSIDISSVADGTYTVRVIADDQHLLSEATTSNNSASSTIRIAGDTVTWLSDTSGM